MITKITPAELKLFLKTFDFELVASQNSISFPIIQRIHRRLQQGHKFSPIKVLNGIIIDGHHRYISLTLLNIKVEHTRAGKNCTDAIIFKLNSVNIDLDDYDTFIEISDYEKRYD